MELGEIITAFKSANGDKTSFTNKIKTLDTNASSKDINDLWSYMKKTESGGNIPSTSGDDNKQGIVANINDKLKSLLGTQKTQTYQYSAEEFYDVSDVLDIINKKGENIEGLKEVAMRALGDIGKGITTQLQQEAQLRTDINEKVGLQGELSRGVREEIMSAYPATLRFGYGMEQLTSMMTNMMTESGRFNIISRETIETAAKTARSFVGNLSEMGALFNQFEKVGLGAADAMKAVDKAGVSSLSLGLNSKKTTELLRTDLGKLNEFGFKNGVDGLARMVQKSVEFRMSMDSVYKLADKVFSPESALELSANLQVLGGAIGDFNDPLKLMYMATNNVEGLQDALIGAAGTLATYNTEQGRFEITGVNLRRAKAMAQELGISYEELSKGAIAAAERSSAASDLMMSGLVMEDKEKEFITNLSQMKGGKMVIEIPQSLSDEFQGKTEIALADLTDTQKSTLLANQKAFEKMSSEDIARGQLSATENIQRDVAFMAATARGQFTRAFKEAGRAAGLTGEDLQKFVSETTTKMAKGVVDGTTDFTKMAREFFNEDKKGKTSKGNATQKTDAIDVQEAENKRKEQESKSENTKQKVVKHEHTIGSIQPVFDEMGRMLLKNPSMMDDMFSYDPRSYTSQ
jgi:hypothetical protein